MINSKTDFRHTQVLSGPNITMNNQFPSFLGYLKYRARRMHVPKQKRSLQRFSSLFQDGDCN
jgi:hypothetical protein